jgi:hypothetical protein
MVARLKLKGIDGRAPPGVSIYSKPLLLRQSVKGGLTQTSLSHKRILASPHGIIR